MRQANCDICKTVSRSAIFAVPDNEMNETLLAYVWLTFNAVGIDQPFLNNRLDFAGFREQMLSLAVTVPHLDALCFSHLTRWTHKQVLEAEMLHITT